MRTGIAAALMVLAISVHCAGDITTQPSGGPESGVTYSPSKSPQVHGTVSLHLSKTVVVSADVIVRIMPARIPSVVGKKAMLGFAEQAVKVATAANAAPNITEAQADALGHKLQRANADADEFFNGLPNSNDVSVSEFYEKSRGLRDIAGMSFSNIFNGYTNPIAGRIRKVTSNARTGFWLGQLPPGEYVLFAYRQSGKALAEWLLPLTVAAGEDASVRLSNDNLSLYVDGDAPAAREVKPSPQPQIEPNL